MIQPLLDGLWNGFLSLYGALGVEGTVFAVIGAVLVLGFLLGIAYALYRAFGMPLRRHERARLLLDLIEVGLERGQSPEHTLGEAAAHRERALGRPVRRLAARLRQGERLGAALEHTPGLLPPAAVAMIQAGEGLGNLRSVIPACRRLLRDGVEHVSLAHHYLVLIAFVTTPAWVGVFGVLTVYVLPKFRQITEELGTGWPGLLEGLLTWRTPLLVVQGGLLLALWTGVILYCGGPRLLQWLAHRLPPAWERWRIALPWNRRRVLRDFATLLAVALDAGLPESRALALAGAGTGSLRFRAQAEAAQADLARGVKLPETLARLDESGEFRWRLTNAVFGRGGFQAALAGWIEALEARAFRDEQLAAQALTTGLVLLNGVLVALLTAGVFQLLVNLIWTGVLW
jgi:type II secretory pathway component PulF